MKTQKLFFTLLASSFLQLSLAQDRTTVTASSNDISDNLDLKAVASIFGDASDLEDFERRLNDPKTQISNLDLNNDNQVDYLRVIESTEKSTHLIIIQSVLERDIFQDVATIEVEKDSNNQVQVQVVGNTFMYGNNYIYEPVYVRTPIIYDYFWVNNYQPYYSSYYWGYYPTYYYAWNPYPIYRYRSNVNIYINNYNHYNYVNIRRSQRAVALHNIRRSNGYEVQNPNRSFASRNANVKNRYELDQVRNNAVPRTGVTATNPRTQAPANTRDIKNVSATRATTAPARVSTANNKKYTDTRTRSAQTTVPKTRSSATSANVRQSSNVRSQAPAERSNRLESTRSVSPKTSTSNYRQNTVVNPPKASSATVIRNQNTANNSTRQQPARSQRTESPRAAAPKS